VVAAMRRNLETFNFPLHCIIFTAGQGGEEIDPQIVFIYNFLSGGIHSLCYHSVDTAVYSLGMPPI